MSTETVTPKRVKCDVSGIAGFIANSGTGFCPDCGKAHRTRTGSEIPIRYETEQESRGRDR